MVYLVFADFVSVLFFLLFMKQTGELLLVLFLLRLHCKLQIIIQQKSTFSTFNFMVFVILFLFFFVF